MQSVLVYLVLGALFTTAFAATKTATLTPTTRSSSILFRSNIYTINLDRDCATYTDAQFIDTVTTEESISQLWTVAVVAKNCTNRPLLLSYQCYSLVSVAQANSLCTQISTDANNLNTDLAKQLQTTKPYMHDDDGTCNNAIFALFTLIALPIFCVVGFVLWYKNKQREADNQYLQDTATFSSVAAHQPDPYYDPKAVGYPAQPQAYSPYPAPIPQQPFAAPGGFPAPAYAPPY